MHFFADFRAASQAILKHVGQKAIFINLSQDAAERGKARSKRSALNEEGMAFAMSDEEDRSGEAAAGRIPDKFMKVADQKAALKDAEKGAKSRSSK